MDGAEGSRAQAHAPALMRRCAPPLAVVAGAVGALYGPLHGGANEAVLRMLQRIGSVDNVPAFLEGVKARKERMFGFGHR